MKTGKYLNPNDNVNVIITRSYCQMHDSVLFINLHRKDNKHVIDAGHLFHVPHLLQVVKLF